MVKFEMTEEEAKIMANALENYLSHMRVELAGTHRREFREALKEREKALEALFQRLKKLAG
jgi:hypothetical protein